MSIRLPFFSDKMVVFCYLIKFKHYELVQSGVTWIKLCEKM